jgi:mRNA interferase MazF
MDKDFDTWNKQKKSIHAKSDIKFYHPRDIWWCRLGLNIGYEQDGKDNEFERPVLVLKSFGPYICLIAPLTTSEKKHMYRIPVGLIKGKEARVIVSQIKVVDTKRFVEKIGVLDIKIFREIQKHIRHFF